MPDKPEEFLDKWHQKADWLLDKALEFLAGHEECPFSDGVLGEWVEQLARFRFAPRHLPSLVRLASKLDPLLAEAGIRLAAGAAATLEGVGQALEEPLVRLLRRSWVDPWIVHALAGFLGAQQGPQDPPLTGIYRELVEWMRGPSAPEGPRTLRMIMRTRYINPREELVELFEHNALQSAEPTERDRLVLPILEEQHRTSGWRDTVAAICKKLDLDPREHFAALKRS